MTKSTGVGRGGRRIGAGRKPGSHSKRSEFLVRRAAAEDLELPVPRLLRRMNDNTLPENYRDSLAMAVAPYFHAKLATTAATVRILGPEEMTDDQLREWIERAETAARQAEEAGTAGLVEIKPNGSA